uniref:Dickkopf WNT signaling pathway inhibitor 1 n=1 Tax=Nothoprocta perdicaria TaxID=30464 RepID=A0A8C6ZJW4_NOTPE
LACRRRRKRCLRDAMCCPGTACSNGICAPPEPQTGENPPDGGDAPDTGRVSPVRFTPGEEGDFCLRSSDCAPGLCCARHFWSKMCKPVLREGQVCTRHRRKGAHGLELFQRCPCAQGLACRAQRGADAAGASRLHTCQPH